MIAIVLVGGKHRILSDTHPNIPHTLVPIAGEPIASWLTYWLKNQGFKHIIFSAGYGADEFRDWASQFSSQEDDLIIDVVTESRPMGTAGATASCLRRYPASTILVINGNSLLLTDLKPTINQFQSNPNLDGMILSTSISNAGRFGSLECDANQRLIGFHEKQSGTGPVNAGLYLFRSHLFENISSDKETSLEYDCFPTWLKAGKHISVEQTNAPFIDMGTPKALKQAEEKIKKYQLEIMGEEATTLI
tara:strand:+ start:51517 stop:52260 length:744 start_codon:yes stop_codon:yes gene_type:complete